MNYYRYKITNSSAYREICGETLLKAIKGNWSLLMKDHNKCVYRSPYRIAIKLVQDNLYRVDIIRHPDDDHVCNLLTCHIESIGSIGEETGTFDYVWIGES